MVSAANDVNRPYLWTIAVFGVSAPLLITLCSVLWRTPYPINEAVALFEDVANRSPVDFLIPDTSYYRPLFHLTLMGIWDNAGSLEETLALVKLLHIAPAMLLVLLLIWHLRPRTFLDAAAAAVSVAVVIGSPGFRDNLEIPLSYTAVGMPIALGVWILLNRQRSKAGDAAIVALTLVAVGFKEQGLVLIPVAIVAWWMRAPGTSRRLVLALTTIAVGYVLFRLQWRGRWPLFEQSMGLGFSIIEPNEAAQRFGAFPFWMYAYNSASTISNVLFAEPSSGLFYISRNLIYGNLESWEVVHLWSSVALTAIITWWGIGSLRSDGRSPSYESRTFVAAIVAVTVCGILSFNYSRDRLGGMAVVFYSLAAFFAMREAAQRAISARASALAAVSLILLLVSAGWCIRAVGTVEWARRVSERNQLGWLVQLAPRRVEFTGRTTYLRIMESMIEQGTIRSAPRATRYPRWIVHTFSPE